MFQDIKTLPQNDQVILCIALMDNWDPQGSPVASGSPYVRYHVIMPILHDTNPG
jgi:hypothetical protein